MNAPNKRGQGRIMTITKTWHQHLLGTTNNFAKDDRGNIAIMTGAMLIGITLFTGGSIDLYNFETNRKRVQDVVDRCTLSATRLDHNLANSSGAAGKQEIKDMIYACAASQNVDLPAEPITVFQINNDKANGYREVRVKTQMSVPTTFLKLANIDDFNLNVDTAAAERDTTVEISVVLDMSGSMSSWTNENLKERRVDEMKRAANTFVNTLLVRPNPQDQADAQERTSISIVPYSNSVSLGRGMFDIVRNNNRDHNRSSCIYFRDQDFSSGSVPNFRQRQHVPHFALNTHHAYFDFRYVGQRDVGSYREGHGYFDAKPWADAYHVGGDADNPFETEVWMCPDDPHAYMIAPYEEPIETESGDIRYDGESILTDSKSYRLIKDLEDHLIECDDTVLYRYAERNGTGYPRNRWAVLRDDLDDQFTTCATRPGESGQPPLNAEEALAADHLRIDADEFSMVYASNDPVYLSQRIDQLKLNGSTSTQVGMKWGELLLNPGFRQHFAQATAAGVMNLAPEQAGRPFDYDRPGNFKYIVLMTDGAIRESRKQGNEAYRYDRSYTDSRRRTSESKAINQFKDICEVAKSPSKNIRVFTIGFALEPGSTMHETLKNCASPGDYYAAEQGELEKVFKNIAATIDSLSLRPV